MGSIFRVAGAIAFILSCLSWRVAETHADPSISVPGLALRVAPIVDVGSSVRFTLVARSWPGAASASIRFVSPHHGFTGNVPWDNRCRCFTVAVHLGKVIHPLEPAHAWATLRFKAGVANAAAGFQIRGLAPGGRQFAPGGSPYLQVWVADPQPRHAEVQHYCAWVHAADDFGIAGLGVRIVVHLSPKPMTLSAGKTNVNGIACAHRSIDGAPAGAAVSVDIYAGSLHGRTRFTPRS